MGVKEISVTEVYRLIEEGGVLNIIDVRSEEEFKEVRAIQAKLFPLDQINAQEIEKLSLNKDEPVYFICRSGRRSLVAAEQFAALGFAHTYNVTGGTSDWVELGFPVTKG